MYGDQFFILIVFRSCNLFYEIVITYLYWLMYMLDSLVDLDQFRSFRGFILFNEIAITF